MSVFLAPNKYMDIGSVGAAVSQTGGQIFFYPRFDLPRDAVSLESQLQRMMRRYQGYNVTMRFRCSSGMVLFFNLITLDSLSKTFRFEDNKTLRELRSEKSNRPRLGYSRRG